MDTRILENFIIVAKEKNISKAAKLLHISQPNLSRQMSHLEQDLGTTLFIKTNRSTLLTDQGKRFLKRAEEIVTLEKKTRLEFKSHHNDIYGEINIGAGETQQFKYIALATKLIKQQYPHIDFHFYSSHSEDIIDKLNKGLLEFGLLLEPVNTQNLYTIPLQNYEPLGLLIHKDSPYYNHNLIKTNDLPNIPLIIARKSILQENNLLTNQNKLNIVATCNLSYNAEILVEQQVGCYLSIYKNYYDTLENIHFIPLEQSLQRHWLIACKQVEGLSEAHQIFLKTIKQIITQEL